MAIALSLSVTNISAETQDILTLSKSSVVSDDTDVPRNVTIELDFSKNICDLSVLKQNSRSIHLLDKDGNSVKIKITFPDTQVQNSYKKQIFVTPSEPLIANESYTLIIENTLTSKDGEKLDKSYMLNFKTGEHDSFEENSVLTYLGEDIMEFDSDEPVNTDTLTTSEKVTESSDKDSQSKVPLKTILIVLIVSILVVSSVIIIGHGKSSNDK